MSGKAQVITMGVQEMRRRIVELEKINLLHQEKAASNDALVLELESQNAELKKEIERINLSICYDWDP